MDFTILQSFWNGVWTKLSQKDQRVQSMMFGHWVGATVGFKLHPTGRGWRLMVHAVPGQTGEKQFEFNLQTWDQEQVEQSTRAGDDLTAATMTDQAQHLLLCSRLECCFV